MAKKIVRVEDKKKDKKSLDLGALASVVMENKDAVGKIIDGFGDIINADNKKSSTKKSSTKKKTTKKTVKKESKSDLENIMDIAGKILK